MKEENKKNFAVNDNSQITIPIRNLIGIVIAVGIAVTGYFHIVERINFLEHKAEMAGLDIKLNSEFRGKWPRGELGSLPDDAEQNMRLTHAEKRIDTLVQEMNKLIRKNGHK